ncbi:hypothetical protein FEE95_01650 [Maribacter algarum]|uniref:Uncharacterized protein n=1 Tax=Maribacter algarum (ex Zhang et al. 2020) TaxID=2578118 RepID=A0A5S3PTC8_9FLAO|nr:hypothetical protein [Maribacter algarum]TMM58158.1 hypothetical protein FEE95_01650 [Maribacter algarum]
MEEIKILVFALVSFLSTEDIPIGSKLAEIDINVKTKQIRLHQYDIYSLEQYKENAKAGLDTLMRTNDVIQDLSPISMTSKHIYEEDGKLNAILYLQYQDLKDLRKISFYADEAGNLSYPYLEDYRYDLSAGRIDGRYVHFDANQNVQFRMGRKEYLFKGMYNLAGEWKQLEDKKFMDISETFSKEDFEKLRKFIFKNGDRKTYRNFDNDNPHYSFETFDVYLGTGKQPLAFNTKRIRNKDYTELVIHDQQYYNVYLISEGKQNKRHTNLKTDKVYWHNRSFNKDDKLKEYLSQILEEINQ